MTVTVDRSSVARLVIRSPNWLGDAVMALPAIAAIRAAFPDTTIAIAALSTIAPLFEERTNAEPDAVVHLTDARTESSRLAAQGFDTALLLPNSFHAAWIARRAGIRERWGYATNLRGWMLTRAVRTPRGSLHQSNWYLELVRGLGIDAPDILPRVTVHPETGRRASAILHAHRVDPQAPLVGFAPGAAYGHAKRWPPRRVADLIARLTRDRRATCVLVGTVGDRSAGREIESVLPADVHVLNLIGRTDLRLLAGVLAACDAFVSNDSGAMHLAAAAGVPVAAIFGPTNERATAPLGDHDVLVHHVFCRPCMLRDCPIDHRCMKGITVDAVFAAVSRRLEGVK